YAAANKATILTFSSDCRLFKRFKDVVGASPYLWLPHIVAIYNGELSRLAIEEFDTAENIGSESRFRHARTFMRARLQAEPLLSLFHYQHEQTIHKQCLETRGVNALSKTAGLRLKSVEGEVKEMSELRQRGTAYLLQVSLALVSVATLLANYTNIQKLI